MKFTEIITSAITEIANERSINEHSVDWHSIAIDLAIKLSKTKEWETR
jgi:hypothetical protein